MSNPPDFPLAEEIVAQGVKSGWKRRKKVRLLYNLKKGGGRKKEYLVGCGGLE